MIYEQILITDQKYNGVKAISSSSFSKLKPDEVSYFTQKTGCVIFNEEGTSKDPIFNKVYIPKDKCGTYLLCQKLFENHKLLQRMPPLDKDKYSQLLKEDKDDVNNLIEGIYSKPILQQVREIVSITMNDDEWKSYLKKLWWQRHETESAHDARDLCAFEQIILGGRKRSTPNFLPYSFWFKYYFDEIQRDAIEYPNYFKSKIVNKMSNKPVTEFIEIMYQYYAKDTNSKKDEKLCVTYGGGFFVGISIEGMIALGTLLHFYGRTIQTSIFGVTYDLYVRIEQDKTTDEKCLRAFNPRFIGGSFSYNKRVIIAGVIDDAEDEVILSCVSLEEVEMTLWEIIILNEQGEITYRFLVRETRQFMPHTTWNFKFPIKLPATGCVVLSDHSKTFADSLRYTSKVRKFWT